jgi:cell division GTPase FtsZ
MSEESADDPALDRVMRVVRALRALAAPPGKQMIGLDFHDVKESLTGGGGAAFGEGEASGPGRAARAAERALADLKASMRR